MMPYQTNVVVASALLLLSKFIIRVPVLDPQGTNQIGLSAVAIQPASSDRRNSAAKCKEYILQQPEWRQTFLKAEGWWRSALSFGPNDHSSDSLSQQNAQRSGRGQSFKIAATVRPLSSARTAVWPVLCCSIQPVEFRP